MPWIYNFLSVNIQPATIVWSKSQCILPRSSRHEVAAPTDRQWRFWQERVRCLIGRLEIDVIIYTYFRSTCQILIIVIFSFQAIRKIRFRYHLISQSRWSPGRIHYLDLISHSLFNSLEYRHWLINRCTTIITKLTISCIYPYYSYRFYFFRVKWQEFLFILQQDDALTSSLKSQLTMLLASYYRRRYLIVRIQSRIVKQTETHAGSQHMISSRINFRFTYHILFIGIKQRFHIDFIPTLQIKTCLYRQGRSSLQCFHIFMMCNQKTGSSAIGNYIPVKSPVTTENFL